MENKKLNAIVIGATGAVGRELTDYLLADPNYNKVTVPVRRTIDRWENLSPEKKGKLNIVKVENLDFLSRTKEQIQKIIGDDSYDVLFNTLGSRVGRGDEEFYKVDFTYVVESCRLCEKLAIPHYSNCSSMNANKDSWFMYCRVKGQAEEEAMNSKVHYVSIHRPGIILHRDNDYRIGEAVVAYVPFIDKIESKDIGKAMLKDDLDYQLKGQKEKKHIRISNNEMVEIAKTYK